MNLARSQLKTVLKLFRFGTFFTHNSLNFIKVLMAKSHQKVNAFIADKAFHLFISAMLIFMFNLIYKRTSSFAVFTFFLHFLFSSQHSAVFFLNLSLCLWDIIHLFSIHVSSAQLTFFNILCFKLIIMQCFISASSMNTLTSLMLTSD